MGDVSSAGHEPADPPEHWDLGGAMDAVSGRWCTGFDVLGNGWQVRAALDLGFLELRTKLHPTKPLFVLGVTGVSVAMLVHVAAVLQHAERHVTIVMPSERDALVVEEVLRGSPRADLFDRISVVGGSLDDLSKTEQGTYGGGVVFAYGVPYGVSHPLEMEHHLQPHMMAIARLCGWEAKLLFVDQPCLGAPAHVLEAAAQDEKHFESMLLSMLERLSGRIIVQMALCRRRVKIDAVNVVGNGELAAATYCFHLSRKSSMGHGRAGDRPFSARVILREADIFRIFEELPHPPVAFINEPFFQYWKSCRAAANVAALPSPQDALDTSSSDVPSTSNPTGAL